MIRRIIKQWHINVWACFALNCVHTANENGGGRRAFS